MCDCEYENCGCNSDCVPCAPVNCVQQAVNDALAQEKETLEGYVTDAAESASDAANSATEAKEYRDETKDFRDQAEVASNIATDAVPKITDAVITIQETADAVKQMGENLEEQIKNYLDDVSFLPWVYNNGSANGGETSIVIEMDGGTVIGIASVYVNGNRQHEGLGFTFNSVTQTLTLADALDPTDELIAFVSTEVASPDATDVSNYRHVAWLYNQGAAVGGETILTPPYTFKLVPAIYHNGARKVVGLHYQPQDNNTITLKFPVIAGDIIQVILGGTPDEFYAQADSIFTTLASNAGASMIGTASGESLDKTLASKTIQWVAGAIVHSGMQMVQFAGTSYTYLGSLPHTLGANPTADGGVWSPTNTGGLWVTIEDGILRSNLASHDANFGASLLALNSLGTVQDVLSDYITPEMFGAVGNGIADDTAAWKACAQYASINRKNIKPIFPGREYFITDTIRFKYTTIPVIVDMYGCKMRQEFYWPTYGTDLSDMPGYDPATGMATGFDWRDTHYIHFWGGTYTGNVTRKSIWLTVNKQYLAQTYHGGFKEVTVNNMNKAFQVVDYSYCLDCRFGELRDTGIVGRGDYNIVRGLVGDMCAGDFILVKSRYSVYSDCYVRLAGVLPTDAPESQGGGLLAMAQDGDDASHNLISNIGCQLHGSGGTALAGTHNTAQNIDCGYYDTSMEAKNVQNGRPVPIIYIVGTGNRAFNITALTFRDGIDMHNGAVTGYIEGVNLGSQYVNGTYVVSANGTYTNCYINNVTAINIASNRNAVILNGAGCKVGNINIYLSDMTFVEGNYVARIMTRMQVESLTVTMAGFNTNSGTVVSLEADCDLVGTVKVIDSAGVGVAVQEACTKLPTNIYIAQQAQSTSYPIRILGTYAGRRGGILIITKSGAVDPNAPFIDGGTVSFLGYRGSNWSGATGAVVRYPSLVDHTMP